MLVKKVAFGNSNEAFVEDRFSDGLNIIYSNDNNRGKTLVMQGLMYSIGYESIFPSSFEYKERFFYSSIEFDGNCYEFLRKKNTIVVKSSEGMQFFNNIFEFRSFFNRFVFEVPEIIKNEQAVTVDLSLLYEIFFIGQDNRNASGLISRGRFNKVDFKNMLYSLGGLSNTYEVDVSREDTKKMISKLQFELKSVRKKIVLLKANPDIAQVFSKTFDSESVQEKIKTINRLNVNISSLKRSRQREINRKSKLENLVSELNSLNRDLSVGHVKCGSCGSDKVVYSNNDITFEVSNVDVRREILNSIALNIQQKAKLVFEYSAEINRLQFTLNEEMSDTPPNFSELILYKEEANSDRGYDEEAFSLSNKIALLKSDLTRSEQVKVTLKEDVEHFDKIIREEMMGLYKLVDPNGNLEFNDIFTKRDSTFSGSEEQEFYFCKIVAIYKIIKHSFPIIIDSFRDGELSSYKENKMLEIYKSLNKQIIITSTLKKEEYQDNKYESLGYVNSMDYSHHVDCRILSQDFVSDFLDIINEFPGVIV